MLTVTEKETLAREIKDLLNEYSYEWTDRAINKIIDTWYENKEPLIEAFKKHPNYQEGKYMIAFDSNFYRANNPEAIRRFCRWLESCCVCSTTFRDALPQEINEQREREVCCWLPSELFIFITNTLELVTDQYVTETLAENLNECVPNAHIHAGAKMSKSMNKLFKYLGYDKHPEYNREFAKYSDALNPIEMVKHTCISVHPCDYLTMSFGNSWSSCHTIDKTNQRDMPGGYEGMYSSGTMSYLLDGSSMVMYTLEETGSVDDCYLQPKVNRQMYHYEHGKLIQGRLYPGDNNKEIIDSFREIMQDVISNIFEYSNMWTLKRGTDAIYDHVLSRGTHYRDYTHFNECTISFAKEIYPCECDIHDDNCIHIGHSPICIECGWEHSIEGSINCCHANDGYYCADCGCYIDPDDVRWVGDDPYCEDCASYCEICGEYHHCSDVYYIDGRDVCAWCRDEYYSYCENCDEWHRTEDMIYVESENGYVCEYCANEYYSTCSECGATVCNDDMITHNGESYCESCYEDLEEIEEIEIEEAV